MNKKIAWVGLFYLIIISSVLFYRVGIENLILWFSSAFSIIMASILLKFDIEKDGVRKVFEGLLELWNNFEENEKIIFSELSKKRLVIFSIFMGIGEWLEVHYTQMAFGNYCVALYIIFFAIVMTFIAYIRGIEYSDITEQDKSLIYREKWSFYLDVFIYTVLFLLWLYVTNNKQDIALLFLPYITVIFLWSDSMRFYWLNQKQ
jgi:hypothetical protein